MIEPSAGNRIRRITQSQPTGSPSPAKAATKSRSPLSAEARYRDEADVSRGIEDRTPRSVREGSGVPAPDRLTNEPWVRAVIATPAQLEGLSRSSELRG